MTFVFKLDLDFVKLYICVLNMKFRASVVQSYNMNRYTLSTENTSNASSPDGKKYINVHILF